MKQIFEHGGNLKEIADLFSLNHDKIIDFSANVNPLPVPVEIVQALKAEIKNIPMYPEHNAHAFRQKLGKYLNLDYGQIIAGNGSTELIYLIVQVVQPQNAIILAPTFSEYKRALGNVGAKLSYLQLKEVNGFSVSVDALIESIGKKTMLIICNPNNPTGQIIKQRQMIEIMRQTPDKEAILLIDEAFIDMNLQESVIKYACLCKNIFVLRSMTKFFGLAGLRIGYAAANRYWINKLYKLQAPWTMNLFAQTV
ncbi:MAG: threonine-phosphate decarboxylase, partial [Candidatus Omnitrophota bacterium]